MAADLKAIALGSMASSLVANPIFFIYGAAIGAGPDAGSFPLIFAVWIVASAIANILIASTAGLAWRAIASHFGANESWFYWLPATLVGGLLPFAIINGPAIAAGHADAALRWFPSMLPTYVFGATLGGLTAYFAWLIRRPDRDAPNPPTSAS